MKRHLARVMLWLAFGGVAVFAAGWWALDRWLESAGGRGAVERSLGDALGFPVRLGGDFGVRLLPSIGVGGTEFLADANRAAPEAAFLRGRGYSVELALAPLWRGELRLESLRLDGGHIDLSRLPETQRAEASGEGTAMAWIVREIVVTDVEVRGLSAAPWRVASLRVEDLEPGAQAPFDLRVEALGRLRGRFGWEPGAPAVSLVATWTDALPGRVDLDLDARPDAGRGALTAAWQGAPADAAFAARLSLHYEARDGGFRIAALRADLPGQAVEGEGCLLTAGEAALNLRLEAASLDLDALQDWAETGPMAGPAAANGGAAGAAARAGTEAALAWIEESLRLRLRVGELRSGGMEARGVELRLGAEPDCSALLPQSGMRRTEEPLQ